MTRKRPPKTHYSLVDEMFASPTTPMPEHTSRHQLTCMADALNEMMHAPRPGNTAWRVISDAVNLLETLVLCGEAPVKDVTTGKTIASHWRGCDGQPVEVGDSSGLLLDAITAMAKAGERAFNSQPMRLDGPGLQAVRAVLEDYQTALECLPARTMVRCHRMTEKRIREIFGRIDHLPDGVHVMAV